MFLFFPFFPIDFPFAQCHTRNRTGDNTTLSAKRITVHVFEKGRFPEALSLCKFLKHCGIDAVIVSKHAVQVIPESKARTVEVLKGYKWGWDRKEKSCEV